MKELAYKHGFPLFTQAKSTKYLLRETATYVVDIWSMWNFIIRKQFKKSKQLHFQLSLLEQAQYFYEAAEKAPFKSKPLLYYYSFLNFAKIVLNIKSNIIDSKEYYHGIDVDWGEEIIINNARVKIKSMLPPAGGDINKLSVAYQLMVALDVDVNALQFPYYLQIKDLLSNCVGIHRTYCETTNEKEKFFRLDNPKFILDHGVLKYKTIVHDCTDDMMRELNRKYIHIIKEDKVYYWTETWPMTGVGAPKHADYYNLSKQIRDKGIWPIIDGTTCLQYISTDNISLPVELIIYYLMFFFGSITRYQPYIFDDLLTVKERWIVEEFLKSQPKQFLYLMTSKILGKQIYKSMIADL